MTITAKQVQELREQTGAGMMECKKALLAANGDMEMAIEAMRIAGTAKAAKKAGNIAAEGCVEIKVSADGLFGVIVEINCQTDFVARDQNFKAFADAVAQCVLVNKIADVTVLADLPLKAGATETVEQARLELINKLGENIQIRRIALVEAPGVIGTYVHGGRIGGIVAVTSNNLDLAKDLAMHVVAANPVVVDPKEVSPELVAKEKEIFIAQSQDSGKPADIIEKMVAGRINKFLSEISLVGQPFVKDPSKTVGNLLSGEKAQVVSFVRFEVGEGIEKPVENFAEAVMAQISGGN